MNLGYLGDLLDFFGWLWRSVLYPYVVQAFAQLLFDGVGAWQTLPESLYVLFCFFTGRSHRPYPVYLKSKKKRGAGAAASSASTSPAREASQRAGAARATQLAGISQPLEQVTSSGASDDDGGSKEAQDSSASGRPVAARPERTVSPGGGGGGARPGSRRTAGDGAAPPTPTPTGGLAPVYLTRRWYTPGRGESVELPSNKATLLVPLSFPLTTSESLHRLVGNVIGPIQQSTVSTLPARHQAPYWPPHVSQRAAGHKLNSPAPWGGGGGAALTTDEYSSGSSVRQGSSRFTHHSSGGFASVTYGDHRAGNEFAGGGGGFHAGDTRGGGASPRCAPPGAGSGLPSVVYRRLSSKVVDFDSHGARNAPYHAIPSITIHHVLSYQATRQKVLVLDLDETLCHTATTRAKVPRPPSFSEVIPTISGAELVYVWERPHLQLFLTTMSKLFNLVLFTSASKPYADSILRRIDPGRRIKQCYYRHDCHPIPCAMMDRVMDEVNGVAPGRTAAAGAPRPAPDAAPGANVDGDGASPPGAPATAPNAGSVPPPPPPRADGGTAPSAPADVTLMKDLRILKVPPELIVMIDNDAERVSLQRSNVLVVPSYIPRRAPGGSPGETARGADPGAFGATRSPPPYAWRWRGAPWLSRAATSTGNDGIEDEEEEDNVLLALIPFLEALTVVPDTRSVLRHGKV